MSAKILIKATYYEDKKTVVYEATDGSLLFRTGGTLSWRFNNPGNLTAVGENDSKQSGRIGSGLVHNPDANVFAIFSSYEAGEKAKRKLLKGKYADYTIPAMLKKYAPKNGGNDPEAYANFIFSKTGIPQDKKIKELDDNEFEGLVKAIKNKEGGKVGTEHWEHVTNITVSDGTRPVPNYPLDVTLGSKTYEWMTNTVGKLPTIFHTEKGMNIEVKVKNSTGKEETVYKSTMNNETKNILLKKNFSQFTAPTLLDKPNPPRDKNQPKSITYIVRSEDTTLDGIATRYNVSTSVLAKDNGITESTKIFPGQMLVIYDKRGSIVDQSEQLPWKQNGLSYPVPPIPSIEVMGGKNKGSALANLPHDQREAPWMAIAIREAKKWHGTGEKTIKDNYHHLVGAKGSLSSIPWCASFVNYCLQEAGYDYSKSYTQSSQFPVYDKTRFIEIKEPIYGAIMVMRNYKNKDDKFSGQGHVSLVYARTKRGDIAALGGNQGGAKFGGGTIKISEYPITDKSAHFSGGYQKFFKFYIPISYKGFVEESQLCTIDSVDKVNDSLFGISLKSNNNEGGGK